jgi:hypothetical protein
VSKMRSKVEDRDRGFAALLKRAGSAGGLALTVGIHEADGNEEHGDNPGVSIATVGAFHEFGLGHNPRRSFIADWADENEDANRERLRKMADAIVRGAIPSGDVALERLGNLFVGEIQKRMAEGIDPPLDPKTIARKGSSTPLIDTGQLRSAITYKVEKG